MRRKKEERREVGERNSEKERKRKYILNERGERNLLNFSFFSSHEIDVHCSNETKKKLDLAPLLEHVFGD